MDSVVADFRAKTEELFYSLHGQSAEDIEKTVYAYVQSQIDEYGLDAEIVDVDSSREPLQRYRKGKF